MQHVGNYALMQIKVACALFNVAFGRTPLVDRVTTVILALKILLSLKGFLKVLAGRYCERFSSIMKIAVTAYEAVKDISEKTEIRQEFG